MKVLAVLLLSIIACSQGLNLAEKATALGLTTLVDYLTQAGLADTIATGGPFTVFGPTNAAFAALPDDIKQELTDPAKLADVLKYHVLNGKVLSSALSDEQLADTLLTGKQVRINIYDSVITASGRQVTNPDQEADNGVIHVVDSVLLAPVGTVVDYVSSAADFSTLLLAVTTAGLEGTLAGTGPFTVFAPTNAAFADIPQADLEALLADKDKLTAVLTMHVVGDTIYSKGLKATQTVDSLNAEERLTVTSNTGGVMVNGEAKVEIADVTVSNGAIHAIDKVLMPVDSAATKQTLFTSASLLTILVVILLV